MFVPNEVGFVDGVRCHLRRCRRSRLTSVFDFIVMLRGADIGLSLAIHGVNCL